MQPKYACRIILYCTIPSLNLAKPAANAALRAALRLHSMLAGPQPSCASKQQQAKGCIVMQPLT
jgi:hypothetical protein